MSGTSAFVRPTNESTHAPVRILDLAFAPVANVLESVDPQTLAAFFSQSCKTWHHWIDLSKENNPRPRKLFTENSACNPDVVVDLPIAMGPSSSAITDAIIHELVSPRLPSPAHVASPRDFNSAPAAAHRVPTLTAAPSSVPERSVIA